MHSRYSRMSALIVDDSRAVRKIFGDILRHFGMNDVEVAADGVEALVKVDERDQPFDLIFLDLNMPRMDGVQTIQQFASRKLRSRVVILSLLDPSLMRTVSDLAQRLNLCVGGVLSKPAGLAAVESTLNQALDDRLAVAEPRHHRLSQAELRSALDERQITVFYQPKVSLAQGRVIGVEALARIRDPEHGLLGPGTFVATAESEPILMSRLTQAVLAEALPQAAAWRGAGLDLDLAFNLSILSIRDRELPDYLGHMVAKHRLSPGAVTAEIPESRALSSLALLEAGSRLRVMGFKLAIDDYGTGESSLSRLCDLPFTQIKIDRKFVHGAAGEARAEAVLKTTIELGARMNMEVVAEGVERLADWQMLANLGCDQIQGFLASRPIPAEQIPIFVKMWSEEALDLPINRSVGHEQVHQDHAPQASEHQTCYPVDHPSALH